MTDRNRAFGAGHARRGGLAALRGAGKLAFGLGLVTPYGLAWVALGAAIATRRV